MSQHAVDRMQQLSHDGAQRRQRFLAVIDEVPGIGSDVRIVLCGAQSRHVEGGTNRMVAGLGQACLLMDTFPGFEGARVKAGELYPFTMEKAGATARVRPSAQWRWFRQCP